MAWLLAAAALWMVCGCSRPAQPAKSEKFFADWLQAHGESNVVTDVNGVGIAGNPTRLRSSLNGSQQFTNGAISAEVEFRVRIPDQREIIEYVAGAGTNLVQAENDAKVNFILSTFHVVYRSFLNPNDPHQTAEKVVINGQPRELVFGDTMTRNEKTNRAPDMLSFREQFRQMVISQPLSPRAHWIKIVYANHRSKTIACAVTLDNNDSPALTDALKNLPWPRQEGFYMVKQFIVVK